MLNLKNRFLSFTNGKTQEKHQVTGVQQIFMPPIITRDKHGKVLTHEKSKEIAGFIIHTTYKVDHEIKKAQTILLPNHFRSLTLEDRGFAETPCFKEVVTFNKAICYDKEIILSEGSKTQTKIKLID